jgi:hypothetical protein
LLQVFQVCTQALGLDGGCGKVRPLATRILSLCWRHGWVRYSCVKWVRYVELEERGRNSANTRCHTHCRLRSTVRPVPTGTCATANASGSAQFSFFVAMRIPIILILSKGINCHFVKYTLLGTEERGVLGSRSQDPELCIVIAAFLTNLVTQGSKPCTYQLQSYHPGPRPQYTEHSTVSTH